MNRKAGLIFTAVVGTTGLLCVLLATILGWAVIPKVIDKKIEDEVTLEQGSETFDKWSDVPYPVQFRVFVWNVTNPDDALVGHQKPNLQLVGPFVYRERRQKEEIKFNEADETVEYRQRITYTYDEALSEGRRKDDKTLNVVNTPFISAVMGIYRLAPFLGNDIVQRILVEEGGEGFVKKGISVEEMMFEGFELLPAYQMIIGLLPTSPIEFTGNRFAYYNQRNGNLETEKYKVKTGKSDSLDFGRIVEWDDKLVLTHWKVPEWLKDVNVTNPTLQNGYCNMINGTTGEIYRPFLKKDMTLRIFQTEICRSLWVVYQKDMEHHDIPGYQFSMPPDFYEWPHINENNWCFCTSPGQFSDDYPVDRNCSKGVIRLGPCKYDSPIVTSNPAFLYADETYLTYVDGVMPNEEDPDQHRTNMLLEPNSGVLLRVSKKLQINIELQPLKGIPYFQDLPHFLFPAFYVDETTEMDEYWTDDLKSKLLNPLKLVKILKWTVLGIGCFLIGLAAAVFLFAIRKSKGYV